MIVLQESASTQTINFIPRKFTSNTSYNVTIVDETQNKEVYNVDTTAIAELLYVISCFKGNSGEYITNASTNEFITI